MKKKDTKPKNAVSQPMGDKQGTTGKPVNKTGKQVDAMFVSQTTSTITTTQLVDDNKQGTTGKPLNKAVKVETVFVSESLSAVATSQLGGDKQGTTGKPLA